MFLKNFQIEETYFIPLKYDGKDLTEFGTTAGAVKDKAELIKDYYLEDFNAVAFKSTDPFNQGVSEQELSDKHKRMMRMHGEWRNKGDGTGLVFGIVLDGGQFAPVVNADNKELSFNFNDTSYTLPNTNIEMDIKKLRDTNVPTEYEMAQIRGYSGFTVDENELAISSVNKEELKIFNNPGNIEIGQGYAGETGEKYAERFAVFDSKEMGVRALARDLTTKIKRHKGDIRKIISEYAPDNENNTEAYINFVISQLGNKNIITVDDIPALTKAVIIQENKKEIADLYLIPSVFDVGIQLSKIPLPEGTTLEEALKKLNK